MQKFFYKILLTYIPQAINFYKNVLYKVVKIWLTSRVMNFDFFFNLYDGHFEIGIR